MIDFCCILTFLSLRDVYIVSLMLINVIFQFMKWFVVNVEQAMVGGERIAMFMNTVSYLCCVDLFSYNSTAVCAPLSVAGARCSEPTIVYFMGSQEILTRIFIGYCECATGLSCVGNVTRHCTSPTRRT